MDLLDSYPAGNPVGVNKAIAAVRSRGSDGVVGGTGSGTDLAVSLTDRLTMSFSGCVYVGSSSNPQNPPVASQIWVMLYGPNPGTGGAGRRHRDHNDGRRHQRGGEL